MKSNLIYGAVALVMIITIAAFLSEERVENKGRGSMTDFQVFPDGRRPGDQKVRDMAPGGSQKGPVSGRIQGQSGLQGGSRKADVAGSSKGRGGPVRKGSGQGGLGAGSQKDSISGKALAGGIGREPVPVFVRGLKKGEIDGQRLINELKDVTVQLRRKARQGWGAADALRLTGIEKADKATFIDRQGQSTTITWSDLNGKELKYILAYTRAGSLVLVSGQEINMDDPESLLREKGGGQGAGASSARGSMQARDIVKIELS